MSRSMRKSLALCTLAFAAAHLAWAHPSVIEGNDEYEFTYRVLVPKEGSRLWIPVARSDAFQMVRLDARRRQFLTVQEYT